MTLVHRSEGSMINKRKLLTKIAAALICFTVILFTAGCGKKENGITNGSKTSDTGSSVTSADESINTESNPGDSGQNNNSSSGNTESQTSAEDENGNTGNTGNTGSDDTPDNNTETKDPVDPNAPMIYLDAKKTGDRITVSVISKNNPGIASFTIKINYNKQVLAAEKIQKGIISVTSNLQSTTNIPGYVTAVYVDAKGTNENGTLFSVSFKIADQDAESTDFSISSNSKSFINSDMKYVDFAVQGVSVKLK